MFFRSISDPKTLVYTHQYGDVLARVSNARCRSFIPVLVSCITIFNRASVARPLLRTFLSDPPDDGALIEDKYLLRTARSNRSRRTDPHVCHRIAQNYLVPRA